MECNPCPNKYESASSARVWYADISHLATDQEPPARDSLRSAVATGNRAEEMAGKYSVPLVFTDYREMIEKGDLDALVVSVPDDLHYPMTMDALDAGLHVLCEKPLGSTWNRRGRCTRKRKPPVSSTWSHSPIAGRLVPTT